MSLVPTSFNYVVQESIQFNNPVSESSLAAIGAAANGLLSILLPVGSIVHSMLTEAQFVAQIGAPSTTWVLADGRSVAGSTYNTVTGLSTVPDLRSVILRGKDNGRGLNPNGNLALGTYTTDQFASHNHSYSDPGHSHDTTFAGGGSAPFLRDSPAPYAAGSALSGVDSSGRLRIVTTANATGITFVANGGAETAPKTVTVNVFIRIN